MQKQKLPHEEDLSGEEYLTSVPRILIGSNNFFYSS